MIIYQNGIKLRKTTENELEFVIKNENNEENRMYIRQWPLEQHRQALSDDDILHMIIEDENNTAVGYAIMVGLKNASRDITLQRLVVSEKGKGIGRKALKGIKEIAFKKYNAHRLHLAVRDCNRRARQLYLSEGFIEEGTMRECLLVDGEYRSSVMMSILDREYNGV